MTKPWKDLTPRERDCLVAEKVMGLKPLFMVYSTLTDNFIVPTQFTHFDDAERLSKSEVDSFVGKVEYPEYSTDISTAWDVVEKLRTLRQCNMKLSTQGPTSLKWEVDLSFNDCIEPNHNIIAFGDTAPLAICVAALKAMGVNV